LAQAAAAQASHPQGPMAVRGAAAEDPYAVLGVPCTASLAEVKHAYHELSRKLHPDKDHSSPAGVATARFQRLKESYERLCDPAKRLALGKTVIVKPPQPPAPAASRPADPRKRPAPAGDLRGHDAAFAQYRSRFAAQGRCRAPPKPTIDVLDSDDEMKAREAEWEAAEAVRRAQKRRKARYAAEQMRRMRQGVDPKPAPAPAPAPATGSGAKPAPAAEAPATPSYVRVAFREAVAAGTRPAPPAAELEAAFQQHGAKVVSLGASNAVLKVPGGESCAVSCAVTFHGWEGSACSEATRSVYKDIRMVVAPVSVSGSALPGPNPTVVASKLHVVTCDQAGAKLL